MTERDASPSLSTDLDDFLAGGGEAARMIRARDWTGHPLGPPDSWPDALKVALSLVLNSPESMILAWGEELWFFFNDVYFPLLGPRLPWAMGARFDEVWADGWDQARPIVEAALAGESERYVDQPWQLATDRGVQDTWWSFSYSRVLGADGTVAGLFIFTNETTARVLADAALADSQAKLRTLNDTLEKQVLARTAERDRLWDASPDLLAVLDRDGRIVRTNPAWQTLLDHAPEALSGRSVFDFIHPEDVAPSLAAFGTARDGPLPAFENRLCHADGSARWFAWVAAPTDGEVIATGRHVTAEREARIALRHAEDQLRHAQKVEAVGQLTGGVAHDFNNLLTVIRGSADLLRRPGLSDERRRRYVDAIADTADRATRLTSQLLAFARRQALTPTTVDAGASVGALREMIGTLSGPRVAVNVELPAEPCYVSADRSQFDTAIVNIAVNARDAMAGEGELTIRVAAVTGMPAIRSHGPVAGEFVAVALSDSGSGISPEQLDRIFEPFFTTKGVGEGTGLGLSQVFGFAKQSGGEIAVNSLPGAGATFTLYLPRVAVPDAVPVVVPAALDTADTERGCVLVVEDNREVGRFATQALSDLGYTALLVEDGTAALAELDRDHGRFDLVFSDVMMPGISGIELALEVRRLYPELPVVLTSGYSTVLAEQGSQGFDLLQKPYSIDQLDAALGRALRRA